MNADPSSLCQASPRQAPRRLTQTFKNIFPVDPLTRMRERGELSQGKYSQSLCDKNSKKQVASCHELTDLFLTVK